MKLTHLRVNHIKKPLGIQLDPLSFSWQAEDTKTAKEQRWARISIWKDKECVFDSGQDTDADSLDYAVNIHLSARTRYRWKLEVCADNGETADAESWFETGKMNEAWTAAWITTENAEESSVVLTKTFCLEEQAQDARMYLCGLGVYELYINKKKVGCEYLAPGYHSYDRHLQVQTYDVTPYLQTGENEIRIWLGEGWFKGRFGFDGGYTNIYGDRLYAIGELFIKSKDGSLRVVKTDKEWTCRKSPIQFANIYDGEIYDANIDIHQEAGTILEMAPRGCGELCDRYNLPIVKKEEFTVQEILHTPKEEIVYDFGQNLTGWVEFDSTLPKGQKITLIASEILQDGNFYHENLRTAKAEFTYISDGNEAHVRPHFTFYGFRYMKVLCSELSCIKNVTAYHLRSDFDQTGYITTGNEKVNQLFLNALWSQKDNFLDVPTDCPQRDERMGWTGDAQVFSETACYNMDVAAFFRKYLWDMRAEQKLLGGSVPNIVPRLKEGMVSAHGACPWADAGVVIPWNLYRFYGSKSMLAESYPGMKAWVDHQRKTEEAEGGLHLIKGGFHFADWLALDNEEPGPFGKTDPLYIASAYYYFCSKTVAEAARILKKHEEAAGYEALAKEIRRAIQQTYFEDGLCICKTQTASALAIAFDLSPEHKEAEGKELLKRVEDNNNHLNTGFVGTTILCTALTATGNHQKAVDLLLNEDYPGWLYSVNLGATTIWERWNSVLPDGHLNAEGMNSLNHYSYGSIEAWMYHDVCGIQPETPGFRNARIMPHPDRRLGFADCNFESAAGRYQCRWEYQPDGRVIYQIEVPFAAAAVICLPEGIYQTETGQQVKGNTKIKVSAGSYRFEEQKAEK